MKTYFKFTIYLFFSVLIVSCSSPTEKTLTIALSKTNKNCYTWIASADSTAEVIELYTPSTADALEKLNSCDALIITGGSDIFPGLYGKESDTSRCGKIDFRRDTLELALIEKALELGIPILGICRGSQMINVALGGSLIIDIPSDIDTIVKHQLRKGFHEVILEPGTKLAWATNVIRGSVTTNHHQAIDQLAEPLRVTAKSTLDGVIEGVEWKEPGGKSFLMGVQWHPERDMQDNPLSWDLLGLLLDEARRYQEKNLD
jgi:putative glutamine amidotransferase